MLLARASQTGGAQNRTRTWEREMISTEAAMIVSAHDGLIILRSVKRRFTEAESYHE